MKRLTILTMIVAFSANLFAFSQIKVICDRDGEEIYLNGQFKSECDSGEPVPIMVKAGKYTVLVKKDNNIESYYYYKRSIKIGDGVQKIIEVNCNTIGYTDYYYYKKISQSKDILGYMKFLGKFPNSKFSSDIKKIVGDSWSKTYEVSKSNYINSIIQTDDEGYIFVGYVYPKSNGMKDGFVVKLDKKGNKVWEKNFGGMKSDEFHSIIELHDESFIITGITDSNKLKGTDTWIIKLDKYGNIVWSKTFEEYSLDSRVSTIQIKNDIYLVLGSMKKGENFKKTLLIKLDKNGNEIWRKVLKNINISGANSVIQTIDGGYVIAGVRENSEGWYDVWIKKFDQNWNEIWHKVFGGDNNENVESIIQTREGDYLFAGYTNSKGNGGRDAWIVKLDRNGKKIWDSSFGWSENDSILSIIQTDDGGYLAVGYTGAIGFLLDGESRATRHGAWIIKIDKNGHKEWDKILGNEGDTFTSIIKLNDGSYIVSGISSEKAAEYHAWVIKIDKKLINEFDRNAK